VCERRKYKKYGNDQRTNGARTGLRQVDAPQGHFHFAKPGTASKIGHIRGAQAKYLEPYKTYGEGYFAQRNDGMRQLRKSCLIF
jgi:hypothetical protein